MGVRQVVTVRNFKLGKAAASPLTLAITIQGLRDELESDDPNGVIVALKVTQIIGTVAGTIETGLNELNRFEARKLEPSRKALQASYEAAIKFEAAFDAASKIPVSTIRTPANIMETVADAYGDLALSFLQPLLEVENKIEGINNRLSGLRKVLNTVSNVGTLATVFDLAIQTGIIQLERDRQATEDVQVAVLQDLGGELSDDGNLLTLELPEESVASVNAALDAFDARLGRRTDLVLEAQSRIDDVVAKANALIPNGAEQFAADLEAKFEAAAALFDSLGVFDDIAAFEAISDVMSDISRILSVVLDAIQPVLDFFGPVLSLINKVIEAIEDAVGLSALRDTIRRAVQDQIDNLTQPIRDAIEELLDGVDFPELDLLQSLIGDITAFRDIIREIELNPVAQIGDADGAATSEQLDEEAIIIGKGGADSIQLALDPTFDDGYGGLASGGEGDDVIVGTALADLIMGGTGDDQIEGLAGDDILFGGTENDVIGAGDGNDEAFGGDGNDVIRGGDDDDQLFGEAGDDMLFGGDGNDALEGGAGEDLLEGGEGDDELNGGDDDDTLIATEGRNVLDGEGGLDVIRTLGAATAVNTILDATAVLVGGAGRDDVVIGDELAAGLPILAGTNFDGGANEDVFQAGSLDIIALDPHVHNFETLRIFADAGETKTLTADPDSLRGFDRLELAGAGAVVIDLFGGPFQLEGLFDDQPFLFDFSGLAPMQNSQDGPLAGEEGRIQSDVTPLTFQLNQVGGGEILGAAGTVLGMTFIGGAGADLIVGGAGSDLIRPGAGADIVDGGVADEGDRFNLDGATGDVIRGTLAELDGDMVRNFTNRTDRLRIEDVDAADVSFETTDDATLVRVGAAVITIEGVLPKIVARNGVDAGGAYAEIIANNVPPTAVSDDFVVSYTAPGADDLNLATPLGNDLDPDGPEDVRRIVMDNAEFMSLMDFGALGDGEMLETRLGNHIRREGEFLYYIAPEPTIELRRISFDDPIADTVTGLAGFNYDVTEDLPFFGLDSVKYRVRDFEGELSNVATIDFLIRPEVKETFFSDPEMPTVTVIGRTLAGDPEAPITQSFNLITNTNGGARTDRFNYESPLNQDITNVTGGNDYFDVDVAGLYAGGSGNDVFIAGSDGNFAFNGGTNADWLEGAGGDDYLTGGGLDDEILLSSHRLDLPEELDVVSLNTFSPNILLGGGGDNVFSVSVDAPFGPIPEGTTRSRDTIFQLDGDEDIITGPAFISSYTIAPDFDPEADVGPTVVTALGLQDDLIRGFDNEDSILLPIGSGNLTAARRASSGLFNETVFVPRSTGVIATDRDVAEFLGMTPDEFLGFARNGTFDDGNIFPEIDFDTQFTISTFIGAPGSAGGTRYFKNDDFNGFPEIISYAIEADSFADDGGTNPRTVLNVSLKSYRFDAPFNSRFPSDNAPLVADPRLLDTSDVYPQGDFGAGELADPRLPLVDLIPGADISFSVEFDGFYNDRFDLDIVDMNVFNVAPYVDILELGQEFETDGVKYDYVTEADVLTAELNTYLGLAIRYKSFAPETNPDNYTVRRGDAITFDVFENDFDPDGDAFYIRDLFGSDRDFFDGDIENGELIQHIDPNSGFGSGVFTFHAPEDFVPDPVIGYIVSDGEYTTAQPAFVNIDITGRPPVLGDDEIILGAENGPFVVPLSHIFANDFDPETGTALDFESLVVPGVVNFPGGTSTAFQPFVVDVADVQPGDIAIAGPDANTRITGIELTDLTVSSLINNAVGPNGEPGLFRSFSYTLEDDADGGRSENATVTVSMALPLDIVGPTGLVVAEDSALAFDAVAERFFGFGDLEFQSISDPVAAGTTTVIGTVEQAGGDGLVFTPFDDVSGVDAVIDIVMRDELGQTGETQVTISITPEADDPTVQIIDPVSAGGVIAAEEDAVATGTILVFDADAADPGDIGVEAAVDLLAALAGDPASLDASALAAISAALPMPASLDPIVTTGGGIFELAPTANPLLFDFTYTPAPDANGDDAVVIPLAPLPGELEGGEVGLSFEIAPVNDAPEFTLPPSDPADPFLFDVGELALLNLLSGVDDVDSAIDPPSLQIDAGPSAELATFELGPDGILTLTGVGSGQGSFTYSIADEEGARSVPREVFFEVNAGPEAVNDQVTVSDPSTPVLIDAIANDSDVDGTISYVLGPDGLPQALDPMQALDASLPPGLLGSVAWSEADGAFVYTPPSDPSLLGQTDQFFYEIIDDDGATARGSVVINLLSDDPNGENLQFGSNGDDSLRATAALDQFVLGAGGDMVIGSFGAIDGDEVLDFSPDDMLLITDAPDGDVTITTNRVFGPAPDPLNVDYDAPTVEQLLGDASTEELSQAFVGETEVTIEIGGASTTITLLGAFPGAFSAERTPDGLKLSYAPTLSGDGPLAGGDEADDIRGSGSLDGGGGDDIIAGDDFEDDTILGGEGDDVVLPGGGFNVITGGPGADFFLLVNDENFNGIIDFTPEEGDRIGLLDGAYLDENGAPDFSALQLRDVGDGVFEILGSPFEGAMDADLEQLAIFFLIEPTAYSLEIVEPTMLEGTGEGGVIQAQVSRSGPVDAAGSVMLDVASGDVGVGATADDLASGAFQTMTVAFQPGEAVKTVDFVLAGDAAVEADESLRFTLSNPSEGEVNPGRATALAVIRNDDLPPAPAPMATFGEDDAGRSIGLLPADFLAGVSPDDVVETSGGVVTASDGRALVGNVNHETSVLNLNDGGFEDLADGQSLEITLDYLISSEETTIPASATITIEGANDAPEFTSPADFETAENQTAVGTVVADDVDDGAVLTFDILAGVGDGALFDIDPSTGALSFQTAPDFEAPADSDGDNVYTLTVEVSDGLADVTQDVQVTVTDVDDLVVIAAPNPDGSNNLNGSGADETFRPGAGPIDTSNGGGGADIFEFGAETMNGMFERDYIYGFGPDDMIDLGGASIVREINTGFATVLVLDGDGDIIFLPGVADFDETTQLV